MAASVCSSIECGMVVEGHVHRGVLDEMGHEMPSCRYVGGTKAATGSQADAGARTADGLGVDILARRWLGQAAGAVRG